MSLYLVIAFSGTIPMGIHPSKAQEVTANYNLEKRFRQLVSEGMIQKLKGLYYLYELITHPNKPIHCSQLRHLRDQKHLYGPDIDVLSDAFELDLAYSKEKYGTYYQIESGIQATDLIAIKQIKQRLAYLLEQENVLRRNNDLAALDDVLTEKEMILDYLLKNTDKNGFPRQFAGKADKDYQAVSKAINRAIQYLRMKDEEIAKEIEESLVTGYKMMIKENYENERQEENLVPQSFTVVQSHKEKYAI